MQQFILSFMNQFGYIGILLLVALENIFPPIPSEIILTFGGFMTTYTKLNIIGVIIASTIGSVVGALVLYAIGHLFNKEHLIKIISGKLGKILHLKKQDIEKADQWFDTKGQKTVFICRFVPIVRSLISIPAGMSDMPLPRFLLYTLGGTIIWNSVLVILGSAVGENWEMIANVIDTYATVTLVVLVLLVIVGGIWFYRKKRKKKVS